MMIASNGCFRIAGGKDGASYFKISVSSTQNLVKARGGHAAGVVDSKVMIAGGTSWSDDKLTKLWLDDCEIYPSSSDVNISALPTPRAYCAYGSNGNDFIIAGGSNDNDILSSTFMLEGKDNQYHWNQIAALPNAVTFAAGAILNNNFYIACGFDGNRSLSTLYKLDISDKTNKWQKCSDIPGTGRRLPALVSCGGNLYLFGGFDFDKDNKLIVYNDIYKYNPKSKKWVGLEGFPVGGYGWNGAAIDNRFIILTGRADGQIHDDIWLYDTLKQTAEKSKATTIIQTTTAPVVCVEGNSLLLLGGEPDSLKNRTSIVAAINISK